MTPCQEGMQHVANFFRPLITVEDPVEQLSRWEIEKNWYRRRMTWQPISIPLASITPEQIHFVGSDGYDLAKLQSELGFDLTHQFPIHPFASGKAFEPIGVHANYLGNLVSLGSLTPPFFNEVRNGELKGLLSASRSLYLQGANGRLYMLKIPTDWLTPHYPPPANGKFLMSDESGFQGIRLDMKDEVILGPIVAEYLTKIEKAGLVPSNTVLLKDVAAVIEASSGNGYLVRDLTPLHDPNRKTYWVPGFAIDNFGRFQRSKDYFDDNAFSKMIGRAYADLVISTGMQLDTPHGQNVLMEITPDGDFTGRVAFRDLNDATICIPLVAKHFGLRQDLIISNHKGSISPSIARHGLMFGDQLVMGQAYFERLEEFTGLSLVGIPWQEQEKRFDAWLDSPKAKRRYARFWKDGVIKRPKK